MTGDRVRLTPGERSVLESCVADLDRILADTDPDRPRPAEGGPPMWRDTGTRHLYDTGTTPA